MITDGEVVKLAQLARLKLSQGEIASLQKDLESILGYVSQLREIKTEKVKAGGSDWPTNVLRADAESVDLIEAENGLLFQRPNSAVGKGLPVKAIFDHDRGRAK